jgi:hypothetical protein
MSPGKVKATWTPPENWSAEVAERYTLPSIETKSALAEQKKLFDDQLAQLKEKQAAAKAEGAELQAGVKRSEDEGEELKALTAATRERLSQLALSETKIRAGLIDKSRGQAAARRGMTGGRESLFSLSERGFEKGVASYSPRGQRARERNLLSVAEQAAPAGVASGPYANLLSPEAAAALAARASRYPRWTPR